MLPQLWLSLPCLRGDGGLGLGMGIKAQAEIWRCCYIKQGLGVACAKYMATGPWDEVMTLRNLASSHLSHVCTPILLVLGSANMCGTCGTATVAPMVCG